MPNKDNNTLKFNNSHKELPVPFVIYAEFEAITEKISSCQPNNNKSYTEVYQKHTDCGYGYTIVCCYDDKYSKPATTYRDKKAVYKFMEDMLEEVKYCKNVMKKEFKKPLRMTKDDEKNFKKPKNVIFAIQNILIKIFEFETTTIFHNLRGYDSHFIMQEIGEIVKKHTYTNKKGKDMQMNINAIPNNMEKYMAFMLGNHLVFLDRFQFMSSSLEKLVSNLPRQSFKYTSQVFEGEELDLMVRKGVHPYDYMDSFDKFNAKLPPKKEFYCILNDEHMNIYQTKTMNMPNMCGMHPLSKIWETYTLHLTSFC